MKKELKKNIYETVSTLRNIFNKMKVMLEEEMTKNPNRKRKQCNQSRTRSLQ
jgi:hypothetical protein